MTTEGIPVQNPIPAPASTSEPTQPVQSVVHPSQTESELVSGEKPNAGANADNLEASATKPSVAPPTESSISQAVASSEPEAPVDAQVQVSKAQTQGQNQEENEDTKDEPQTGEKRDLDSTTAPASVPTVAPVAEDKKEPEAAEEPEAKKQKLDANSETVPDVKDTKEPSEPSPVAPATTTATKDTNGDSKKAGRPKKEKVKEAVKKVIPGDGIGSRTRSRTKAT
ncbi:hypothetical protein N7456_009965 [Penicillium angulare]|uniref:Uncharacterized protein n=1 Tax=Penicillium angulare TaxID=116970 RepID=A0A9W9F5R2_9EURO|nr:hypothetical protein N7456_009965 [Penicillium angulare]